jgi:biotin carboxyl carrier protein
MKKLKLNVDDRDFEVEIEGSEKGKFLVSINGKKFNTSLIQAESPESTLVAVEGSLYDITMDPKSTSKKIHAIVNSRKRMIESGGLQGVKSVQSTPAALPKTEEKSQTERFEKTPGEGSAINAPMPGKVVAVKVRENDLVKAGDVVLILEAMKMENEITSPQDGKVSEVRVSEGDNVDSGDVLVVVS